MRALGLRCGHWASNSVNPFQRWTPSPRRSCKSRAHQPGVAPPGNGGTSNGDALSLFMPVATGAPVASTRALISRLKQTHRYGLHNNMVLNSDREANFSHYELTPDDVRLEFRTAQDPAYRNIATAFCEFEDDQRERSEVPVDEQSSPGISLVTDQPPGTTSSASPTSDYDNERSDATTNVADQTGPERVKRVELFLSLIKKVENKDSSGAGATVVVDRQKLVTALQQSQPIAELEAAESSAQPRLEAPP